MIYDITNPSDAYTIKTDNFKVAAVACVLLGSGQYGFEPLEEGGERVPIFLFGGADQWFIDHFDADFEKTVDDVMQNHAAELADCLDSCVIGGLAARRECERALQLIESEENRNVFRAERHDQRRSSMNDIGGRAYRMAQRIREQAAQPCEQAPQQVFGA